MMENKKTYSSRELAACIDCAVIKPDLSDEELKKAIKLAVDYHCYMVAINASALPIAKSLVNNTDTGIDITCGFPMGQISTAMKVAETEEYCQDPDIDEIDFVSNFGWIRSHRWADVTADMKAVADKCHAHNRTVKAILETDVLNLDEISKAVECAVAAHVDFVKTSTGLITGVKRVGPTDEVIKTMLDAGKGKIKIKASSCIHDRERVIELLNMGADRIGIGFDSCEAILKD